MHDNKVIAKILNPTVLLDRDESKSPKRYRIGETKSDGQVVNVSRLKQNLAQWSDAFH